MDESLKAFLDEKVEAFNNTRFIEDDPVSIPHLFKQKQDIEIAGFFAATLAWGLRKTIIQNCRKLLSLMDNAPYDFCVNHHECDLAKFRGFCHRTFNDTDLLYFFAFLKHHYTHNDSLETAFFGPKVSGDVNNVVEHGLNAFYYSFFALPYVSERTRKHVAAPKKQSACKRLNMYLRWMVRNDDRGVDFGLWKSVSPAALKMPVDVHVARVAKKLRLLERKQVDWKAVEELTSRLRQFDPLDPVKYDYALFGLGVIEKY